MNRDSHPELGERERVSSFEDVVARVRVDWPNAYAEGSVGSERSWWVRSEDGPFLVAHSWPVRGSDAFWVRTTPGLQEVPKP